MRAALLTLLLACGCGGNDELEGDAHFDSRSDPADTTAIDVVPVDPAVDDLVVPDATCSFESHWELWPRTIDSVTLVDGISRVGMTDRYVVGVQLLSGCEVLAGVGMSVLSGDATDSVELSANAWVPTGVDCPPVAPIVERVVAVPGRSQGNLRVVVTDMNSPGGGLRLTYDREPCSGIPECMCGPGTPPGPHGPWDDCTTDCSCIEGLSCIGYFGIAGPLHNCAPICSDFRDCALGDSCLPPIPDGAPYVCSRSGDICDDDDGCPDGFACVHTPPSSYCEDTRTTAIGRPCDCDAMCPPGQLCIDTGVYSYPRCEIPCLSNAWCPRTSSDDLACTDLFACDYE
jgi:hypothetical protein